MSGKNKGVPKRIRKALIAYHGLRCHWCRRICHDSKDPLYKPNRKATADHLVPVVDGGGDDWENLVVACHYCNKLRGVFQNPTTTQTAAMLAACEFRGRTLMRAHVPRPP
ncbi:HNH endonuclease signature motif containing protein [Methylobacterium ajmalii]|uniref:HNH endonuclease signature motif containing protein n=1 Tax=Methylobacterium ajmalii TaxID=2738439 RepID=A0ABV0A343_9HYPH